MLLNRSDAKLSVDVSLTSHRLYNGYNILNTKIRCKRAIEEVNTGKCSDF